jgi:hypothetical protein
MHEIGVTLCCSSAEFFLGETAWNLVHGDYIGIRKKGEPELAVFI